MLGIDEKIKSQVYGETGIELKTQNDGIGEEIGYEENAGQIGKVQNTEKSNSLPVETGFWSRMKNFWLQDIPWDKEIKVVLTPYQQKVEKEVNDFLHQEITFGTIKNLFKFGKKK